MSVAGTCDARGLRSMEPAELHEDYTSLKRSMSGIANSHASRAEPNPMLQGSRSSKAGQHLRLNTTKPKIPDIAFAALQYLPMPLLVLSSLKTVILANEAMGRLLGLHRDTAVVQAESPTEVLRGQSLSQIGIDIFQDGIPLWVSWEKFLDSLVTGLETNERQPDEFKHSPTIPNPPMSESEQSPQHLNPPNSTNGHASRRPHSAVHDTVVDVIVSYHHHSSEKSPNQLGHNKNQKPKSSIHTYASMIISIWHGTDGEQYFTLTFTTAAHKHHAASPHLVSQPPASAASVPSSSSTTSTLPLGSSASSTVSSPLDISPSDAPLLTHAAPARCFKPESFTEFQKLTSMKDAMLSNMDIPVVAIWKDESAVFPNQAARRLLAVDANATSQDSYDFMSRFKPHTADFERELEEEENPMSSLCREQKIFSNWKIGLIEPKTGKRKNFDVDGRPVFDDKTGEFLVGLVAFKDVTEYTEKLAVQSEENEQQFQLICDTMPQMLWTTTPEGYHDYFSQRWYDYTGLSREQSIGMGWQLPFHDEDLPVTRERWAHSLATGSEYATEYRCRRADGAWRWMLGRALPLRDVKTGTILKWFGTCTDIQDLVDIRESNRETRERLLDVLTHSQMSMWQVDREAKITFYEGGMARDSATSAEEVKALLIGKSLYDCVATYTNMKDVDGLKASVHRVLNDASKVDIFETTTKDNSRWFRSTLVAQKGHKEAAGSVEEEIIGAIGISMDVTELKQKEEENVKLLAAESAAKAASKMKSNFLANMSHEIRTPIAGIIGMSELLMDTVLDDEQGEFAQNIQRSANTLLTVINDILDFSKIESGRLDIEEVQFSLGMVLRDVAKMLSFAAERKQLQFFSEFDLGEQGDLILLGDPGRVRQILTNLLTNSIKFTSDGYVKLAVHVLAETSESTTVSFSVEDTGIGIEEDVKARLFKPFSQADSSTARRFGGTGLGLTISKNLVDLMHGQIALESKPDTGTIATFSIPFVKGQFTGNSTPLVDLGSVPERLQSELSLSCDNSSQGGNFAASTSTPFHSPKHKIKRSVDAEQGSAAAPSKIAPEATELTSNPQHILIVEDNEINQQIALRTIKNMGYSVCAVWNGQEALDYLSKATQNSSIPDTANRISYYRLPSLILMDVQMPVLDGYKATHILRHHAPYKSNGLIQRIPIVAMTASAIQGDREKCQRAGMNDYLAKPVKRVTLEKMIQKWTSSENKLDSSRPDLLRNGAAGMEESHRTSACPGADYPIPGAKLDDVSPPSRRMSNAQSHHTPGDVGQRENASDRGLRLAVAEEIATSLRDAKLVNAATETNKHGGHRPTGSSGKVSHRALVGSPMHEAYPDQHGSSLALTEENIGKLNAEPADDRATMLQATSNAASPPRTRRSDALAAPFGPLERVSVPEISVGRGQATPGTEQSRETSPARSRRSLLSESGRKRSDWSNASTVKPHQH